MVPRPQDYRPAPCWGSTSATHCPHGSGAPGRGLRPQCRGRRPSRLCDLGPDRGPHPRPTGDPSCAREALCHTVVGVHSTAQGRVGGPRLLERGGPHAAWRGDVLRRVFHSPRESAGRDRGEHAAPHERWMIPMARIATRAGGGGLQDTRCLLPDRDAKYPHSCRAMVRSGLSGHAPGPPGVPP